MRALLVLGALLIAGACGAVEIYENPVDHRAYIADEWKTYGPESKSAPTKPEGRVQEVGIRLLNDDQTLKLNTSVSQLELVYKHITKCVTEVALSRKDVGVILVQADISSSKPIQYRIAFQGEVSEELMRALLQALSSGPDERTRDQAVSVQAQYALGTP